MKKSFAEYQRMMHEEQAAGDEMMLARQNRDAARMAGDERGAAAFDDQAEAAWERMGVLLYNATVYYEEYKEEKAAAKQARREAAKAKEAAKWVGIGA